MDNDQTTEKEKLFNRTTGTAKSCRLTRVCPYRDRALPGGRTVDAPPTLQEDCTLDLSVNRRLHDRGSIERDRSLSQRLTVELGAGLEDEHVRRTQDGALHLNGGVQGSRPGDLPEDVLRLRSVREGDDSA